MKAMEGKRNLPWVGAPRRRSKTSKFQAPAPTGGSRLSGSFAPIEENSAAIAPLRPWVKNQAGARPAAQNVQTPGPAERGERLGERFLLFETGRPLISRPVPGGKDKERGSGLSRTNPSPHPSPRFAGREGKVRSQIQRVGRREEAERQWRPGVAKAMPGRPIPLFILHTSYFILHPFVGRREEAERQWRLFLTSQMIEGIYPQMTQMNADERSIPICVNLRNLRIIGVPPLWLRLRRPKPLRLCAFAFNRMLPLNRPTFRENTSSCPP
jgi:hypothetical protein